MAPTPSHYHITKAQKNLKKSLIPNTPDAELDLLRVMVEVHATTATAHAAVPRVRGRTLRRRPPVAGRAKVAETPT